MTDLHSDEPLPHCCMQRASFTSFRLTAGRTYYSCSVHFACEQVVKNWLESMRANSSTQKKTSLVHRQDRTTVAYYSMFWYN